MGTNKNRASAQAGGATAAHPPTRGPVVVAIGASAGGLAALKRFFASTPPDTGIAYVVVVHLSPEHRSRLAELLQTDITMPVQQVTETVPLEPDRVYVIPPAANLEAIDTHLRLAELQERRWERAPIDHFLRTLSRTHDGDAVCVILTGTGSDGTLGLREIKEKGGLTLVQDPEEAEYDGMPKSAIATGMVDLVLPVSAMPSAILGYVHTRPRVALPDEGEELSGEARRLLQKLFAFVRARTGRDFTRYKPPTVLRRVARRMQLTKVEDLEEYVERLGADPDEPTALADDLLISVTSFFRDAAVFEELEREVVPKLLDRLGPENDLRVWSVGCATGEEAYSLAIVLREAALARARPPRIQIFATDLHGPSLERAREGFFPGDIDADVTPERLRRWFQREDGGYRIGKEIRDLLVFASHNVLTDPPFSRMDLVSCRNLLISLQREVQRHVIELLHYALKPDGFLIVGSAETVDATDLFATVTKRSRIYRRRSVAQSHIRVPPFPVIPSHPPGRAQAVRAPASIPFGTLHQRMVERYALPSLLLSPEDRVVHLSTHAGRYLVQPGGAMTSDVYKLVREELRTELRALLEEVRGGGRPGRTKPINIRFDREVAHVVLDVRPTAEGEEEGFVLVVFDERIDPWATLEGAEEQPRDMESHGPDQLERVAEERDLAKRSLQAVVERYEASQEEMQASNEELQSINEELRSAMEELETSKEELQSVNEELLTVNEENRHKVEELAQLSSDLQNFLAATDIATVFLDRELRILRFTPKVGELFNVRATDRGRPLSDITHHLADATLLDDARRVLDTLVPVEREVRDEAGRWYLGRVLPYRDEDRIRGVVLTLVDITARKAAEQVLADAKASAERITEALHEPLLILEPDLRVRSANAAFYAHFGIGPDQTVGRRVYDIGRARWNIVGLRTLLERVLPEDGHFEDFELEHEFESLGLRTLLLNGRRLADEDLVLLGIRDITERKRDERTLRETQARLGEELRASRRLHAMLARTFRARGLDEMLDEVLHAAIDLQGADFGNIQLVRDDGTLEIVNQAGLSARFLEAFRAVRADDESACGRALRTRRPVLVADVTRDGALAPLQDVFAEADVRAVLSVPLVARSGEALGVLSTHFREPRAWSERDEQTMVAVARQSADVLERLRSEELLRQLAEGLEERVEERTHEVRALASTLTMAEQEERRRISGILHDDLQQLLYGIQMRLALARGQADTGNVEALLRQTDQALGLLGEAVSRTRRLTVDLSPPVLEGESFVEAMQWIQTQMRELHDLDVDVEGDPGLDVASRELHVLLFHVVRELLFNVAKHADTSHACVEVEQRDDMLWIVVEDRGRGFDPDALRAPEQNVAGGFGLFSARERLRLNGGGMEIESRPGEGTRISIYAPISPSS